MAANLASDSLDLMPVSEAAKNFRDIQGELGTTSAGFRTVGEDTGVWNEYIGGTTKALGSSIDRIREANAVHNKYAKTIDNAVLMTQNLREISIRTGKDLGEVTQTYNAIQQTFRLSLDKDMDKLTQTTLAAENFGKVLGIGSAEAIEKFRMRTQDMGTSLETAQLEMAGMVSSADDLRKSNKDLSISNKQYADLVYDSVSADTRSTQNLRLKNQIIQNTIDLMLKQGRTQKEAMEAGKNAAAAATKGSHAVETMAGMELAKTLQASSAKIKALEDEGKADEAAAAQKELMEKLTVGMSPEEKAKAEIRLGGMVEAAKKGELKDTFSLGERLNNLLGSQQSGMIERRKKQYALYADKEQSTMVRLLQTQEGMTADVAEETAAAFKKAHEEGNESYLDGLKVRENKEKETADNIATAGEGKGKQGGLAGQIYDQAKKLLDNPLVTGLGAVAATTAYAIHTAAMYMHAKALAKGSIGLPGQDGLMKQAVGAIDGKLGGTLFKGVAGTAQAGKGIMGTAGSVLKGTGKGLLSGGAIGSGLIGAGIEGVSSIMDYRDAKARGASGDELASVRNKGIGKTAGAGLGAWGGAAAGAAVGSVVPIVGTVIGGLIGAAIGGYLGKQGGEMIADNATGATAPGAISPTSGATPPPSMNPASSSAAANQTGPGGTIAPRYDGTEPNGGIRFILDPAGAAAVSRAASGGYQR